MPPNDVVQNLRKNEDYIKYLTLTALHVRLPVAELVAALHQNQTLIGVKVHSKYTQHLTAQQLKDLLAAIAVLPQLRELSVSLPPNRTHLSGLVVECARRQQDRLQKFSLAGFDDNGCKALADVLRESTSLQEVKLSQESVSVDTEKAVGPVAVAKALEVNPMLERLVLSCSSLCDVHIQTVADALSVNRKLRRLDLRTSDGDTRKRADYTPLLAVLANQKNESLIELQTDADSDIQKEISFYTKLIASGTPHFLRRKDARFTDWLDLLVSTVSTAADAKQQQQQQQGDVLSILFYALREDPSYLLFYSADNDKLANERPNFQQAKPTSSDKATTLNMKMRRKPTQQAPSCMQLNVPL